MENKYLTVNKSTKLCYPNASLTSTLFPIIDAQRTWLRQWLPWVDTIDTETTLINIIEEQAKLNIGGQRLSTYILHEEIIVGSVALVHIDKIHRKAEMGYWLRQDYQGKGIMTASLQRLLQYIYNTTDINRIYIKTAPENEKSRSIPIRLGFQYEGTLIQDALLHGQFIDMEIYAITRKKWLDRKK